MSLDFSLHDPQDCQVFSANITHNLNKMADAAGIYEALWRPDEVPCERAGDLVPALSTGLSSLLVDPDYFRQFDSPNGWGVYDHFVPFVAECMAACMRYPDARVEVDR